MNQHSSKLKYTRAMLISGLMGMIFGMASCGDSKVIGGKPLRRTFNQQPQSTKPNATKTAKTLRIIRRTHIDLFKQLPKINNFDLKNEEIVRLQKQEIKAAILTAQTALTLGESWTSALLSRSSAPFADLYQFQPEDLDMSHKHQWEQSILDSLVFTYADWFYQNKSSQELLSSKAQIATDEAISFFKLNINNDDFSWPGTHRFQQINLSGGVLMHPSLYALFPTHQNTQKTYRYRALLSMLLCTELEGNNAHQFKALSSDQLNQLDHTAISDPSCKSCHQPIHSLNIALQNIYTGHNFDEWLVPAETQEAFHFLGRTGKNTNDLFDILRESEGFHTCSASQLFSVLRHRPLNVHEFNVLAKAMTNQNDTYAFKPQTLLLALLNDEYFENYQTSTSVWRGSRSQETAYLNRKQWQSIANQLAPNVFDENNLSTVFSSSLDTAPESPYFWEVSQISKILAEHIVAWRYQDPGQTDAFLIEVGPLNKPLIEQNTPNIAGSKGDLHKRIHRIWFKLTSQKLSENNPVIKDLVHLFELVQTQRSEEEAWQSVLHHILSSQAFFTY